MKDHECPKCFHKWKARVKNPLRCPNCTCRLSAGETKPEAVSPEAINNIEPVNEVMFE